MQRNLKHIHEVIGTEEFNDLIATWLAGDEEYISDSLIEGEDITCNPSHYMEHLYKAGYRDDNFPYEELREYCIKVRDFLSENLIIPLS